jgi:DNA-binding MarR family transcriptional regulator
VFDDALASAGMTTSQFSLLRALGRAGAAGIPLSRLAEMQVMDRTSLYRAIAPLEKSGWVGVQSGEKGRAKVARLTELGETALGAGETRWQVAQDGILHTYGADRWADAHKVLNDLTEIGLDLWGS